MVKSNHYQRKAATWSGNTWKRPGNALDTKASIRQKNGKDAIMGEALNPKLQAMQDKVKAKNASWQQKMLLIVK